MMAGVVAAQRVVAASVAPVDIYPVLRSSPFSGPASGTSHSVNVSALTGERSIVFVSASAEVSVSFPAGWTVLISTFVTGAWLAVAYRDFQSGDPASITVTTAGTAGIATHAVNIQAGTYDPAVAPLKNSSPQTTATPNPAALTDPSGTRPKLAIAWWGTDGNASLSLYPANMGSGTTYLRDPPFCSSNLALQTTNAASFDPGAFTLSASQNGVASTLFIVGFPAA